MPRDLRRADHTAKARAKSTSPSCVAGDIILGDRDGVIVIPSGDAASLYDAARQSHERDLAKTENARRGLFDRGWVDGALERKGCEIVEGPWR